MTISAETAVAGPYNGDGSTTAFTFAFKCFSKSELAVYVEASAGAQALQTLTTNYSVSLNSDQDASPGGTITMVTAPASGEKLHIVSDVPLTQTTSVSNSGGYYPNVENDAKDRATLQKQQINDKVDRALVVPLGDSVGLMPSTSSRLGKFLAFDGVTGDPLATTGTESDAIDLASSVASAETAQTGAETAQTNATTQASAAEASANSAAASASEAADDADEVATNLAAVQSLVAALPAGTVVYGTKAAMDAVTPTPPAMAYVLADSTASNNGLYGWPTGASAWAKDASDLNDRLTDLELDALALPDSMYLTNWEPFYVNDFSVNTDDIVNFNGGTHVHDTANDRITVTAGGGARGVMVNIDAVEDETYRIIVKTQQGTAQARLYQEWSDLLQNPLPDGWFATEFVGDAGGSFGRKPIIAADTAGDFHIEAIAIYKKVDREAAFADVSLNESTLQWDLYNREFESDDDLDTISRFGGAPAPTRTASDQLSISPGDSGDLYLLDGATAEGDTIEGEIQVDSVPSGEKLIIRPYWNNAFTSGDGLSTQFDGSNFTIESPGTYRFTLIGDGSINASAELQKVVLKGETGGLGAILIKKIKLRRTFKPVLPKSFDVNFGIGNVLGSNISNQLGFVIVGSQNSLDDVPNSIIIGSGNKISTGAPLYGSAFSWGTIVIGANSEAKNGRCVVVGVDSIAGSVSGTAIGSLAGAYQDHDIALGRGARTLRTVEDSGNASIGKSVFDLYLNSGICHRYTEEGTGTVIDESAGGLDELRYHGHDAFDDVDGTDTSVAGGDVAICGGRGTGTAGGGDVHLKVAPAGGADNNTKNALRAALTADTTADSTETGILIFGDGQMRRVKMEAASGGKRTLYVDA